jgi:hypothetical protein
MTGKDADVVEALAARAERGRMVGGRAVLDAARRQPLDGAADLTDERRPLASASRRPRRAVLVAATVVVCAVLAGALALAGRQDTSERLDTGDVPSTVQDLTTRGWHVLTPLPLPPNRWPNDDMPTIWTGQEAVVPAGLVDGDARIAETPAFDPTTGTTRLLPAPPRALQANSAYTLSAWTGREVILAADGDRITTPPEDQETQSAFALNPAAGTWRPIARPPQRLEGMVWAGDQLWGWTRQRAVFTWSPQADRWTSLAPDDPTAPKGGSGPRGPIEWTGRELLILTRSEVLAFEPSRGWRQLPAKRDFEHRTMTYQRASDTILVAGFRQTSPISRIAGLTLVDLASGTWHEVAGPPGIKTSIDHLAMLRSGVAAWSDVGIDLGDGRDLRPGGYVHAAGTGDWTRLPDLPTTVSTVGAVAAGDRLVVWGQPNRDQAPTELRAAVWVP